MSTGLTAADHQPQGTRAERVLAALRRFASGGVVCELPSVIARHLAVSTDTVQRGIADLVAAGIIEPTPMRAGKARAYRIVDASPQPFVGSPHAAKDSHRRGGPVGADSSAVVPLRRTAPETRRGLSPIDEEGKRWLDEFELTEAIRFEYARKARGLALRVDSFVRDVGEPLGAGVCEDCGRDSFALERYGRYAVCVRCASQRYRVRVQIAA